MNGITEKLLSLRALAEAAIAPIPGMEGYWADEQVNERDHEAAEECAKQRHSIAIRGDQKSSITDDFRACFLAGAAHARAELATELGKVKEKLLAAEFCMKKEARRLRAEELYAEALALLTSIEAAIKESK